MKKKIIITISIVLLVIVIFFIGLFITYKCLSGPVEKKNFDPIEFKIDSGTSLKDVIKNLESAELIKSRLVTEFIAKKEDLTMIQAGTYTLNKNMTPVAILTKFSAGEINIDSVTITFIEGKRLSKYISLISETFNYTEDEIYKVINSDKFLDDVIAKYWFITNDVKNKELYFPLEGYLFADTYQFYRDATIETIIYKMLDTMGEKLAPYEEIIKNNNMNVHDILAKASIIELEGNSEEDRQTISQVINSRLASNMSLGMDVTTYYAVKKNMGEELTFKDINTVNPYNTRDDLNMAGKLPVGPICSPSLMSINAVFNPKDTKYLYFYADISTGKVYFANDYAGFMQIIREVN